MKGRRGYRALLRLVGPAVLVALLWRIDGAAIHGAVASADPLWILGAVLLNPVAIHLKVVRWRLLLRRRGIDYGLAKAWLAFLASAYVAMLTPGRVGDVLRVQYLRAHREVPYAEGLASIVLDRISDLWVLAAFVAVAIVHYGQRLPGALADLGWVCVALTFAGPLVLLVRGVPERLFGFLFRRALGSEAALTRFLEAMRARAGWALLATLPATVLAFLVNYAQGWLVARSMGIELPLVEVACLLAVASLLGLLPISVSGLGTREAFFAIVFPTLGLTAEHGVGFGLLVFAVIYVAITAAGFVAWQISPPPPAADAGPAP